MLYCKYCKILKNTYFKELLQTAASENELIGFFYKNKKMKTREIQQKLCKICRKKTIAIRSSKYEQQLYNCFKNINFAFSLQFLKQNASRNKVPLTEL